MNLQSGDVGSGNERDKTADHLPTRVQSAPFESPPGHHYSPKWRHHTLEQPYLALDQALVDVDSPICLDSCHVR